MVLKEMKRRRWRGDKTPTRETRRIRIRRTRKTRRSKLLQLMLLLPLLKRPSPLRINLRLEISVRHPTPLLRLKSPKFRSQSMISPRVITNTKRKISLKLLRQNNNLKRSRWLNKSRNLSIRSRQNSLNLLNKPSLSRRNRSKPSPNRSQPNKSNPNRRKWNRLSMNKRNRNKLNPNKRTLSRLSPKRSNRSKLNPSSSRNNQRHFKLLKVRSHRSSPRATNNEQLLYNGWVCY